MARATLVPAPHTPLLARLQGLGHTLAEQLVHKKTPVCAVCCAELAPGEIADGFCQDRTACCARTFAQRCW